MCESLGVTEAFCGCPIRATMDTVEIGRTREGYAVEIDRYAAQADGIIVCNRIKAHPVLYGSYESGLCKMIHDRSWQTTRRADRASARMAAHDAYH